MRRILVNGVSRPPSAMHRGLGHSSAPLHSLVALLTAESQFIAFACSPKDGICFADYRL